MMKYEKNYNFFLVSVGLISVLVSGVCQAELAKPWWYSPVLTLSGGVAEAGVGRSQILTMANDYTTYQYTAKHRSSERFTWGIYTGTEIALNSRFLVQMGLGYYDSGAFFSTHNALVQGIDPESADQFLWQYKVKNQSLLAEVKLRGTVGNQIHPYLALGLGTAFNYAYDYTVKTPPFITFTPLFTNHTNTNFTYVLGIGVEADLSQNYRFGIGYRYANSGQANLGKGFLDDKIFSESLRQSNLYIHSLLAQFTWRLGK